MKSIKKRLAALGVAATLAVTSAVSMTVSAATPDAWPAFYVPYSGNCYASAESVRVNGLKWSSSQLAQIKEQELNNPNFYTPVSMELEFRTVDSSGAAVGTHDIWKSKNGSISTNMPNASFEFQFAWLDNDDVSFVIPDIGHSLKADETYYAGQSMAPTTSSSGSNKYYVFECELGDWYAIDSFPIRYSQRPTLVPFGSTTSIRG